MKSVKTLALFVVTLGAMASVRPAAAIDEFQWNSVLTGSQPWQLNGNWSLPDFPNAGNHSAVISVTSDLTLDVGATDVAVALLNLNPSSGGADINISSSGGHLLFQNNDNNIGIDPAPSNPDVEDILQYEGVNHGRVYVTSNGAAGSTNTISAPIRLANNGFLEGVDFFGTQSVTLAGAIDIVGTAEADSGQLRSYLPAGTKLNITGPVNLTDAGDNTTARFLVLNNYYTTNHAEPPRGTIELSGPISGAGGLVVGWTWDVDGLEDNTDDAMFDPAPTPALPFGTVILSGNNSFTGNVVQARGNLVVAHDNALGTSSLSQGGPAGDSKEVGYDLISSSDDRKIANNVNLSQWLTIKGASSVPGLEAVGDHSIEFSGQVITTNSRGWVNLLPAGKTLTLSGPQYALEGDNANDPYRIYTVDGSGRTLIVGGVHNREPGDAPAGIGHFRKRGEGTVVIDYNEANLLDTPTDYGGHTFVEGGNLHFATASDLPDPSTFGVPVPHQGQIMSTGGAVGLDSGTVSNATFLGLLNNSQFPNAPGQAPPFTSGTFLLGIEGPRTLYSTYDAGGLMLAASEYTQNLDFTTGNLANAANMTLAAWETGSTYTGTITPSTTIPVNANTYQLGGGAGTLTLPNNNQLTGTNALLVTNGGEVKLNGTHNYTGKTRIIGKYNVSLVEDATVGTADNDGDGFYNEERQAARTSSTLTVTTLANAGAASGIGSFASSTDVTGLTIQGSRLKYIGAATSTNRLFTVGTAGATLDSSGSGAMSFTNTAALGIDVAENRTGVMSPGGAPGNENNEIFGVPLFTSGGQPVIFSTEDLVIGMRIRDVAASPHLEDDLEIKGVMTNHAVEIGERVLDEGETAWGGITAQFVRTITFGPAPARFLTLSGSNTGNNTLAPLVANAADIGNAIGDEVTDGYGTVGIHKTGVGKWIVTGNNTYTGATNVDAGTLLINGAQTGNGLTTVADGATFGGTGQIGGGLTMLAGSTFTAAFSGGAIDPFAVLGNVDLSALGNILNITGVGMGMHTLLTYTGTLTGTFESTSGVTVDYGTAGLIKFTVGGTALVGDYNGNGTVDAADYTVWRDNLGAIGSTLGVNRDPNNGGNVSIADYNSWKANFGMTGGSGSLAGAAVPEPGTCLLLGIALAACGLQRRRS